MNRKAYRSAIRSILSELVRQERLVITNDFTVAEPKTKQLVAKMNEMQFEDVLVVTHEVDENLVMASNNLYHVGVVLADEIDPVSLIGFGKVVMTEQAVKQLEEKLA